MWAFPADCPRAFQIVTDGRQYCEVFEEFPAYGLVLLRLAKERV